MYGIVYFSLALIVYKQQLQIVHESFHTDRPTTRAVTWVEEGDTPSPNLTSPPRRRPIFANPRLFFSQFSHW